MVGVRRFDDAEVLERVMRVFWAQGYEATSIDDLVGATGLKRGSLYNAFGGKERMFLAALDRYADTVERPLLQALAGDDPRTAIAEMLRRQVEGLGQAGTPRGCLVANLSGEVGHRPDAIGAAVRDRHLSTETVIYQALLGWQGAGRLDAGLDLRRVARFYAAILRIVPLLQGVLGDRSHAEDIAAVALAALERGVIPNGTLGRSVPGAFGDLP